MAAARVLYVITDIDRGGGAEQHLLTLVQRLDRSLFTPEVAYLIGQGQLTSDFHAAGCRVHALRARYRGDPLPLWRLIRLLARKRYDLVHTHLPRADAYGAAARWFHPRVALVSTKHNDDRFYFHPAVRAMAAATAHRADSIIAISQHLATFLRAERLVPPSTPVRLIYYGLQPPGWTEEAVDRDRVRASLGVGADALLLFAAGRLTHQKGHEYLLHAIAGLRARFPEVRLLIAGRGELRPALESLVARLDLAEHVHFLGLRPDVPTLMRAADIVVLPSLWEGFGLVLLEAMQARRPIVATSVGAIPEVVQHGVSGLLAPPGDAALLGAALAELCSNADTRARMGQAGADRLAEFSIGRMVSETEQLYAEVLTRRGGIAGAGNHSVSVVPHGSPLAPRVE